MDKMLSRGSYIDSNETKIINAQPEKGWKILGMGKEFTKIDKFIYIINYIWTFGWTIIFIIGTIYNLSNDASNAAWMNFWKTYLIIQIIMAIISLIWFTLGGYSDLKKMMFRLKQTERDHSDDGFINRN